MDRKEAEKHYLNQDLTSWSKKAMVFYNLSVLFQRHGDVERSITYLERATIDGRMNTSPFVADLKQLLCASICDWSNYELGCIDHFSALKSFNICPRFSDKELIYESLKRKSYDVHDIRSKYSISGDSFVYASFCQPEDINYITFGLWMKILEKTTESTILLLLRHNLSMEKNLKDEAKIRGVDPRRLVFIDCTAANDYFELYSLPDLFVDTTSTKSKYLLFEALVSGTPAIALDDDNLTSSQIIKDVGLGELVVESVEEYGQLAVDFQFDEEKFMGIVRRLDDMKNSGKGIYDPEAFKRWVVSYERNGAEVNARKRN